MKYLIILSLVLFACSPQFHINKAKKHTEKAIDKGAVLTTSHDTLYVNDTITTIERFTINDTVYIETTNTIESIVYQTGEIRYITKKDKRKEVRSNKVESKRDFKLAKSEQKTERTKIRKENKRPFWIFWLFLGLITGFFLAPFIRR